LPLAIALRAAPPGAAVLHGLQKRAAAFEPTASHATLGYPPHMTLAVCEGIDTEAISAIAAEVFAQRPSLRLHFRRVRWFDSNPLILYACPEPTRELDELHALLHHLLKPEFCHENYRPAHFVAHCTLATDIGPDRRADAIAFATAEHLGLRVTFDRGDVLYFPPARIVREWRLTPSQFAST
jgi:2'-5' RNA ligase